MSTENETINKLKADNERMEKELSELRTKYSVLLAEKNEISNRVYDLKREKEQLLSIVSDLSKGIANLKK